MLMPRMLTSRDACDGHVRARTPVVEVDLGGHVQVVIESKAVRAASLQSGRTAEQCGTAPVALGFRGQNGDLLPLLNTNSCHRCQPWTSISCPPPLLALPSTNNGSVSRMTAM